MPRGSRCPLRKAGSRFVNKRGDWLTVTGDVDWDKVSVVFDSGTTGEIAYQHLRAGNFKDWLKPSQHGVGYIGKSTAGRLSDEDNKLYRKWTGMLDRCYSPDSNKRKCYESTTVCEEWHNFQTFKDWGNLQLQARAHGWSLDKDLLSGGKGFLYCPDLCLFLPQEVNVAIVNDRLGVGRYGSIGVYFDSQSGRIASTLRRGSLSPQKAKFSTEAAAAVWYKTHKEAYIKYLAAKWRNELDPRGYAALLTWEVPLTREVKEVECQEP